MRVCIWFLAWEVMPTWWYTCQYIYIYISECHSGIWINNFTKVCYSIHGEQNAFEQSRQIDFGGWLSIAVQVQIKITMSDITDENEWEPVHMAACKHCYHPHPVAFWLQSHENMQGPQASLTIYICVKLKKEIDITWYLMFPAILNTLKPLYWKWFIQTVLYFSCYEFLTRNSVEKTPCNSKPSIILDVWYVAGCGRQCWIDLKTWIPVKSMKIKLNLLIWG